MDQELATKLRFVGTVECAIEMFSEGLGIAATPDDLGRWCGCDREIAACVLEQLERFDFVRFDGTAYIRGAASLRRG